MNTNDWVLKVVLWFFISLVVFAMIMATIDQVRKWNREDKKPEEVQTEIGNVHAGMPTFTNLNSEVKDVTIDMRTMKVPKEYESVTIGTEADINPSYNNLFDSSKARSMAVVPDLQKQLDELRSRIDKLEKEKSK